MGGTSSVVNSLDPLHTSSVRFINFEDFKALGTFPRYPDIQDKTITLNHFDAALYNDSLIVYVSHNWIRSKPESEGWDGKPHPGDHEGGKYRLCVEGIETIMATMAPGMKYCYIWFDYGCVNQDADPAAELVLLDRIIQLSDCVFTPLFEKNPASSEIFTDDLKLYEEYSIPPWVGTPDSYLSRAWCRLEMLYAASVPLVEDHNELIRGDKFAGGLSHFRKEGFRPHVVYSTIESATNQGPFILPPFQSTWFEHFHPLNGELTKESDKPIIEKLLESLQPYMRPVTAGYVGQRNEEGKMDGQGTFHYPDGSVYEGQWKGDEREGKGKYRYPSGSVYEGDWKENKIHGSGRFSYANGDYYDGEWSNGMKEGRGMFIYALGDIYDGFFHEDMMEGIGKLIYADGTMYQGEWKKNMMDGEGVFSYAEGTVFEGHFKEDKKHGYGRFVSESGEVCEGEWENDNYVDLTQV
jgi:hypothetical protein